MADVVISSGRHFSAGIGESILDAAQRQGVVLEYGCRTGRCGTCRARLRSGATMTSHEELGLSPAERAEGWILTCVRFASTDVSLEVEDLSDVKLYSARTLPCRIQDLHLLSDDVVKVTLRLPPDSAFAYHPGQYVDVVGQGGLRRSYSLGNAPAAHGLLELHVRRVESGAMSAYWFEKAKANDLLRLRGPLGTCFLRNVAGANLVFLATGTGIAPIKAMLEGLAVNEPQHRPGSVSVYWGGRVPQDLYWNPAEVDLEHRFVPVLSRAGAEWPGARGYVQEALLASRPDIGGMVVYACGSDAMIRSARGSLVAAGLPERSYRADAFVPSGES